jgi:ATP adenylyltransferase
VKQLWAPWRLGYVKGERDVECPFCPEGYDSPYCVHVGKSCAVFLNRYPYANGHALIAPKRHISVLAELTSDEALELHELTVAVQRAMQNWMRPHGYNIGYNLGEAAGAGIAAHLHRHVVPRWSGDTNFIPVLADLKVIPQHIEESAQQLRKALKEVLCA